MRKCKKHPRYQAKKWPTSNCQECLDIYLWDGNKNLPEARKGKEVTW